MPFCRPSRPGTSKLSRDWTNISSAAEIRAGRSSGIVIRRSTVRRGAPDIAADSSSEGSIARNAATISRNATGARCRPWTQIMPGTLNTLTGSAPSSGRKSRVLSRPMFGSPRKIHAAA